MFQFTTTNVINSLQDLTTGLPLWCVKSTVNGDETDKTLMIKRIGTFNRDNVVSITKAVGHDGRKAKATLKLGALTDAKKGEAYRLSIYIRLDQSMQSSYYSNDLVFKGKPLSVEFNWMKDAATTAKKLESIIKKYEIAVYEKPIVKVTADGTDLVINATDEYQRFYTIEVEKYDAEAYHGIGEYDVVLTAREATDEDYDESEGTIEQGIEGFANYPWLLHNLRIPTTMRTRIFATNEDETPIVGAKYNEYVITYCVDRGIMGTGAVGEAVKSVTTHVLYVNQDLLGKTPEGELAESTVDGVTYSTGDIESMLLEVAPSAFEEVRPNYLPDEVDGHVSSEKVSED